MLQRNSMYMNPVDIIEARRMLEHTASKGSAVAQTALRVLAPILNNVPEDLVICRNCAWGANPGFNFGRVVVPPSLPSILKPKG